MGRMADLPHAAPLNAALRLQVRGVVQGVGFRPTVYRLAGRYQLHGWVRNTSWGVEIWVEGRAEALAAFQRTLREEAPPLARLEEVRAEDVPAQGHGDFTIRASTPQEGAYQLISPDIATCPACLSEILDATNRRYRYPFTNCTHCGPRFTIIADVPYDRPLTTMRAFTMCPRCQAEYDDPLDRRFHAQPNACAVCGPQVTLEDGAGQRLAGDPLAQTAALLRQGQIVAIKGLGGYQLACDATNPAAVRLLRARKQRPHKPFAVMVTDAAALEQHATLSAAERALLASPAAPIVLCRWRESSPLAAEVAPASRVIGLMLPYTPLHHLLLREVGRPLVMTSGNLSEEPIARDNDEARRRLGGLAAAFLTHNRDIYARYDDSVWFVPAGGPQPLRRARGYAPYPITLPEATTPILASGAAWKNTFCLTRDRYAFLSQHIGDLENAETLTHYEESIALYERLFRLSPQAVAHDMHPDYLATRYARALPGPHVAVQHHHAHLAACLAEHGVTEATLGVILDGTGYGLDGRIWGGEFLLGDGRGFRRAAHLAYLPLPGGEAAIHRPLRLALAYAQSLASELPLPLALAAIPATEREIVAQMVARGVNTPLTSSMGRLFDAVAAALGLCDVASYEGQAAIALEMAATPLAEHESAYPFALVAQGEVQQWGQVAHLPPLGQAFALNVAPLWRALCAEHAAGRPRGEIAARLHLTVAEMIVTTSQRLREATGVARVALSGGCFQNRLLLALVLPRLNAAGFTVLTHRQVPCNDGGLALGQAWVAHYTLKGA
jgi:hydrogenase maturation protein HypF